MFIQFYLYKHSTHWCVYLNLRCVRYLMKFAPNERWNVSSERYVLNVFCRCCEHRKTLLYWHNLPFCGLRYTKIQSYASLWARHAIVNRISIRFRCCCCCFFVAFTFFFFSVSNFTISFSLSQSFWLCVFDRINAKRALKEHVLSLHKKESQANVVHG